MPNHFAAPHTICPQPAASSPTYPRLEITVWRANPCATYASPISELSPSTMSGTTRFRVTCAAKNTVNAYPDTLIQLTCGHILMLERPPAGASLAYRRAFCERRSRRKARPEETWATAGAATRRGSERDVW